LRARAALLVLLLWPGAGARADAPARLRAIIQSRCAGCHDDGNILDLRVLPAESDQATWLKILEMVDEERMPPVSRSGKIEGRFPLDPAARAELLELVRQILAAPLDASRRVTALPPDAWRATVTLAVTGVLPPTRVAELLRAAPEHWDSDWVSEVAQARLDVASLELCEAIAARGSSSLLPSLPGAGAILDDRGARRLVAPLWRRLFGDEPSAAARQRARQQLTKFRAELGSWRAAWITWCGSLVAGPRLLFGAYAPPGGR
jgi:hypothetical protein